MAFGLIPSPLGGEGQDEGCSRPSPAECRQAVLNRLEPLVIADPAVRSGLWCTARLDS